MSLTTLKVSALFDAAPGFFMHGTTKQPSNQATKQPSNQATKQPSNQAFI